MIHTRLIYRFLLILLIPGLVKAQSNIEPSDSLSNVATDSTVHHFSSNWQWTQDSRGGGAQNSLTVIDDTVRIAPADHVHFTNLDTTFGAGIYRFKFKTDTRFLFAWRVSPSDAQQGTGLILQTEGDRGLSLIHVSWSGFFYGWHNASAFRNTVDYTFDRDQWHEVEIHDTGSSITIFFDGQELPFFNGTGSPVESFFSDVQPGYVGIGGGDNAVVEYQNLSYTSISPSIPPTFSISLDLDTSVGDQAIRSIFGILPDSIISIQIFGNSIKDAVGFGARFEYDATQVAFESFEAGDVLPNAQSPGVDQGTDPTYVEVTAATFDSTAISDVGLLGIIRFRMTSSFDGTTIQMTKAEIRRGGQFEETDTSLSVELSPKPTPDFDGDGNVGFRDFLLFAERFGSSRGEEKYDTKFDLTQDESIGFSDFLLFAEAFGKPI